MFVRDFVHVDQPFNQLLPRFLHGDEWLEPIMVGAVGHVLDTADGHAAASDDGADDAVTCEFGPAREQAGAVIVPVHSAARGALPTLDGDLRIAPFGSTRSHISLSAIWGTEGLDPVETQHVLDTVARTFLQGLVSALDGRKDEPT